MKVGDVVRHAERLVLIVDIVQKKCWRTDKLGPSVNFSKVTPEPHAVVMFDTGAQRTIPTSDLKVIK